MDVLNTDYRERALDFFNTAGGPSRKFVLPDFLPAGSILGAVSWADIPMPLSKIRISTNIILEKLGVSSECAAQLGGFYSGRRLPPILAHKFRCNAGERFDTGGWSGDSNLKMPQRCCEARFEEQGRIQ